MSFNYATAVLESELQENENRLRMYKRTFQQGHVYAEQHMANYESRISELKNAIKLIEFMSSGYVQHAIDEMQAKYKD